MRLPLAAVLDTNWYLGFTEGRESLPLFRLHSIVTRIEMLSFSHLDATSIERLEDILAEGEELPLDDAVARRAAELRRLFGGKLPDAVIAASAERYGAPLLTRDRGMLRYTDVIALPALD